MKARLLTVVSLGLLSAACQNSPQQANRYGATPVTPPAYTALYATSEQACADYGFVSNTASLDRCVSRERAARSAGRMNRDYEQTRINTDARDACSSYGLEPGSGRYDRCVGREVDARSYRADPNPVSTATYRSDQYGYRVDSEGHRLDADGYRIDSQGHRMVRQYSYAAPEPQPAPYVESRPVGQQATRDEFGFRYDAYGNRLDARGNVISPQTR